jgi:uncharacterized protein YbgA (DUF1722 family)/uncharacterized protein YbbK (DUF523 family)
MISAESTPSPNRSRASAALPPIRIGTSTCLLGERVRFDAGHKRDAFLVDTLGTFVEWVPVCPEVEMGLGVPRPALRLERHASDPAAGIKLVMPKTGDDYTARMQQYAAARCARLRKEDLCGYVLKKKSPSCGMERVRVYPGRGRPTADGSRVIADGSRVTADGRGVFADALMAAFRHLPVEEEGRLCDPKLRENFIECVFAYRRLRSLFAARWTPGQLVAFHTAHKYQLLAHSRPAYDRLGRLVARRRSYARADLRDRYSDGFMETMRVHATRRSHGNVLRHTLGFFKRQLDSRVRQHILSVIADYRKGVVPLVAPLTLIRHYVDGCDVAYLQGQVYLDPHPKELMLRNHV